jgi:hypothetical protein
LNDFAGASGGFGPKFSAWIDRGVDARVDVIAKDGPKLAATGVD